MKVVAIVGSEQHTSSFAGARLEYVDDTNHWARTPAAWNVQFVRIAGRLNSNWWQLELDVPAGTRLRYSARSWTGLKVALEFRMDEAAEVVEEAPDMGLQTGMIKGRMRRLKVAAAQTIDTAAGF